MRVKSARRHWHLAISLTFQQFPCHRGVIPHMAPCPSFDGGFFAGAGKAKLAHHPRPQSRESAVRIAEAFRRQYCAAVARCRFQIASRDGVTCGSGAGCRRGRTRVLTAGDARDGRTHERHVPRCDIEHAVDRACVPGRALAFHPGAQTLSIASESKGRLAGFIPIPLKVRKMERALHQRWQDKRGRVVGPS